MKQEFSRQLDCEFRKLPTTWKTLQDKGVTTDTKVKLDFAYSVPTEEVAREMSTMLGTKFGYEVRVSKDLGSEKWRLEGNTQETMITLEILQKWIAYMVQVGVENGCQFEGWEARLST